MVISEGKGAPWGPCIIKTGRREGTGSHVKIHAQREGLCSLSKLVGVRERAHMSKSMPKGRVCSLSKLVGVRERAHMSKSMPSMSPPPTALEEITSSILRIMTAVSVAL